MSKGNPVLINTKTDLTKLIIICLRRILKTPSNEFDQAAAEKGADMLQIMDCLKKRFILQVEPNVDLIRQLKLSAKHAERHGHIIRIVGDDGCSMYTLTSAKFYEQFTTGRTDSVGDAPVNSAPDSVVLQPEDPELPQELADCSTPTSCTTPLPCQSRPSSSGAGYLQGTPHSGSESAIRPSTPNAHSQSQFNKASFLLNVIANSSAATDTRSSALESTSNESPATTPTCTSHSPRANDLASTPQRTQLPASPQSQSAPPTACSASAPASESPHSLSCKSSATPVSSQPAESPNGAQKARPKRRDSEEAKQAKRERDRLRRARLKAQRLSAKADASTSAAAQTAQTENDDGSSACAADVTPVPVSLSVEKPAAATKASKDTEPSTSTPEHSTRSARTLRARKDPPPPPTTTPPTPLTVKTSPEVEVKPAIHSFSAARSPSARAMPKTEVKLEASSPPERESSLNLNLRGTRRSSHESPAAAAAAAVVCAALNPYRNVLCFSRKGNG